MAYIHYRRDWRNAVWYVELARVYRATYLTHYSDTIPALSQLS
jgi:hypothetical protein